MQEPGGGAFGAAGGRGGGGEEGERSGQNIPRAREEQRSSGSSSADEGRDDDARHVVREPRGLQDPGNVAGAGNPDEGAPGQPGPVNEEAADAPRAEQPPIASGPSGDATTGTGSRLMEFCVMVHFGSPQEADMARRSFISNAWYQEARVQQEFRVINSALAVWMSEDIFLFRISINNFLDQLSAVSRNIQRLGLVTRRRQRGIRRP